MNGSEIGWRTGVRRMIMACFAAQFLCAQALAYDETAFLPIKPFHKIDQAALEKFKEHRKVQVIVIKDGAIFTAGDDGPLQPAKDGEVRSVGQVVVFSNQDTGVDHRLIFMPGHNNDMPTLRVSDVLLPGEMWGAEFEEGGSYPFFSQKNPEMKGIVHVP